MRTQHVLIERTTVKRFEQMDKRHTATRRRCPARCFRGTDGWQWLLQQVVQATRHI